MTCSTVADGLIRYTCLPSDIIAFTTTRAVGRDFARIGSLIGIDESRIIAPHQIHSDNIFRVTADFLTLPAERRRELLEGFDAVYTDVRGVCVGVSTADCVPVLLCDRKSGVAAAIHAGWRGTVKRIVENTVAQMAETTDIYINNVYAVIGSSISRDRFEVGDEVYDAFRDAGFDMTAIAFRTDKWHLDLQECNRRQLLACGVKEENIFTERRCTYDSPDLLFSARREQRGAEKCGRNFNAILLSETI